jgi:asparagine synthetase B (glutamine-hydrolysing)
MSDIKPIKNSTDLFHRINRLSSEADWSEDDLLRFLTEEGINPSLVLEKVRADVKQLLRQSPYYWRNRARTLRETLEGRVQAQDRRLAAKLPRKELLGHIEATLARMPPSLVQQFGLEHRNFGECTDEDLRSILLELECIEKLDATDAEK